MPSSAFATPAGDAAAASPAQQAWRDSVSRARGDLAGLLKQNQAYFSAKGPKAVEEKTKLTEMLDAFEKERLRDLESTATPLEGAEKRKANDDLRELRRILGDLKTKEIAELRLE